MGDRSRGPADPRSGPPDREGYPEKVMSSAIGDILHRQIVSRCDFGRKQFSTSSLFIEFVRCCGSKSSNGRVIVAGLIAAASPCPDEQLLNRWKEGGGEVHQFPLLVPFLVAFVPRPLGFAREADKIEVATISGVMKSTLAQSNQSKILDHAAILTSLPASEQDSFPLDGIIR
jgi:hypothetical protein